MTLSIRRAEPADYAQAGAATAKAYEPFLDLNLLEHRTYVETVADLGGRSESHMLFVADYNHELIGSVSLAVDTDRALTPGAPHIRMLGVSPDHQGLGAGRALMEACIDWCLQNGKSTVGLRTMGPMVRAQKLYEGLGFKRDMSGDYENDSWGRFLAYRLDFTSVS